MRAMFVAMMLALGGCIDGFLEEDCDVYVDYLCTCGDPDCETLREQLGGGDASVQESCRISYACFEDEDEAAGQTCALFDAGTEDQCL